MGCGGGQWGSKREAMGVQWGGYKGVCNGVCNVGCNAGGCNEGLQCGAAGCSVSL